MTYLVNRKSLPKEITSYDVLKAVAVLLMIVDHIGYYFYPDEQWFRVVGRMCVPIWFFLVGYARSRDFSPILWVGGGILIVSNFVVGMGVLPLNILFTIVFVRVVLDHVFLRMLKSRIDAFMGWLTLMLVLLPTYFLFEYGTAALILAFIGYIARNKDILKKEYGFYGVRSHVWVFGSAFAFFVSQVLFMGYFSPIQYACLFGGLTSMSWGLYCHFEPKTFTTKSYLVSFLGRYTLEIYVVHLMLFKVIAAVTISADSWSWFEFNVFPIPSVPLEH